MQSVAIGSWAAADWEAAGTVALAVGAIATGVWTLINYRRSKRVEAARWLNDLFDGFYLAERFIGIRNSFEYEYEDVLVPLLEQRTTDRHVPLTVADRERLEWFDTLVNYLEHVLYLEEAGLLAHSDREALFGAWLDQFRKPGKSAARRYLAAAGYTRLEVELDLNHLESLVVPEGEYPERIPEVGDRLRYIGNTIAMASPGGESDQARYFRLKSRSERVNWAARRGIKEDQGECSARAYSIEDPSVFGALDTHYGFDAVARSTQSVVRSCFRIDALDRDAWVYAAAHEGKVLFE